MKGNLTFFQKVQCLNVDFCLCMHKHGLNDAKQKQKCNNMASYTILKVLKLNSKYAWKGREEE